MALLSEIVSYTNRFLRIRDVGDWDNALNGLQIENSGRVARIGVAVDVSTRVLTEAQKRDVDLLIVHHGLFWPGLQPVQGALRRQLRLAFENDIALYGAHLPLDVHPKVGNNGQLVAALGLKSSQPFLEEKGQPVGLKIRASKAAAGCPHLSPLSHSVANCRHPVRQGKHGYLTSLTFSDKFGHSNCVILRDSCKRTDLHFPL
jgi:putative NIF3 family GTP cyclohydrolase 1 type 2